MVFTLLFTLSSVTSTSGIPAASDEKKQQPQPSVTSNMLPLSSWCMRMSQWERFTYDCRQDNAVNCSRSGHANSHDLQCSGRPHSTQTPRSNNTIMTDMHIMVNQLSLQLDNGEANVCRILESWATERCVPHKSRGNWQFYTRSNERAFLWNFWRGMGLKWTTSSLILWWGIKNTTSLLQNIKKRQLIERHHVNPLRKRNSKLPLHQGSRRQYSRTCRCFFLCSLCPKASPQKHVVTLTKVYACLCSV